MRRQLLNRAFLTTLPLLLALLGACATVSPGARPDDMSATHHRAVAKQHRMKAKQHETRHDPNATTYGPEGRGAHAASSQDIDVPYNPTAIHLSQAREHKEHARQHQAAAQTLERFEAESCRQFSKDKRVVCPLIGQVRRVQNIPTGVRLYLASGVPVKSILAHMQCHYAHGRSIARKGMEGCPLYLKGLVIKASHDQHFVTITSQEAQTVREIQRRSRLHVSP